MYTTHHASLGVYTGVYTTSMPPWVYIYRVYHTHHASLGVYIQSVLYPACLLGCIYRVYYTQHASLGVLESVNPLRRAPPWVC